MKPEQLVPSLETCKKLKEKGWNIETCFIWGWTLLATQMEVDTSWSFENGEDTIRQEEQLPAPTVAELMDVLPEIIKDDYGLKLFKRKRDYVAMYYDVFFDDSFLSFASTNPAEALALLYTELKEKGVI